MPKSKSFVFTWNEQDPSKYEDNVAILKEFQQGLGYRRLVCGHEVGASGNKHIQGSVIFKNSHSFKYVKDCFPGAYIAAMQGSWSDQVDYCTKEGDVFIHEVRLHRVTVGNLLHQYTWDGVDNSFNWTIIGYVTAG